MKKIFTAEGRMRRRHYWLLWLLVFLINVGCVFIAEASSAFHESAILFSILAGIFLILQGIKRMHDTDHSGWFLLIPFYNLILALTPGTTGKNRYGADPKEQELLNSEPMSDVLDTVDFTIEAQNEGDTRRALIYFIVIVGFGYFRSFVYQIIPMSYEGQDEGVFSYLQVTFLFSVLELVIYMYMMATVRNGLAKTALIVFFILNVFYVVRFALDQYFHSSFFQF